jgi:hypothetical protein
MYDSVFQENRILVCGDLRSFKAPSPINTYIQDNTTRPHVTNHLIGHHNGCSTRLRSERTHRHFAALQLFRKNAGFNNGGPQPMSDIALQSLQTRYTIVEYFY